MGVLDAVAAQLAQGETVQFRPTGSSTVPLIRSRQLATAAPVHPAQLDVRDNQTRINEPTSTELDAGKQAPPEPCAPRCLATPACR